MRIPVFSPTETLADIMSEAAKQIGSVQPLTGTVVENLEGMAELQMTISKKESLFDVIQPNCILYITKRNTFYDDIQPEISQDVIQYYRVYEIKNTGRFITTVKARNVTYDLANYAIKPWSPILRDSTIVVGTINAQLTQQGCEVRLQEHEPYHTSGRFKIERPMTAREILGGYEGSLKYAYRFDYFSIRNRLLCFIDNSLGGDRGFTIAYKKNLISYEHEINYENVHYSVLGYAIINETLYVGNLYTKVQASQPRTLIVDFSENYSEDNLPTEESLTTDAQNYATRNEIEKPRINFTVDFVRLKDTEEYKNKSTEEVMLGDIVHVRIPDVQGDVTARVLETTYDIVADRYSKLQIGNYKANFYSSLLSVIDMQIKKG